MQLGATPHYFTSKSNGWHKSWRTENGSLHLRGPFIDDFTTACWESRRIIMSAQERCGRRRESCTDEGIWNMWTRRQLSWTYGRDQMGCGHNQYYHKSNAITSLFKVTVWAAHQFSQLILLSVWPRGPHFTIDSYTVFLPLMHHLFQQLGDNQSWNRKGRKAIRDALALSALRSQKSRTQRMLKHKKKKKIVITISWEH